MPHFPIPRLNLPEFGDSTWMPTWMRASYHRCLELMLKSGRYYEGANRLYASWAGEAERVVDLGSGGGGAVSIMLDEDDGDMPMPCIVLSDIHPDPMRYEELRRLFGEHRLDFLADSTPAETAVDGSSGCYSVCSAFHHLPPDAAAGILRAVVKTRSRLLILEPFTRRWRVLALMVILTPLAIILGMTVPFRSSCPTWRSVLTCTLVPIIPFMVHIDGIISVLRTYNNEEIVALLSLEDRHLAQLEQIPILPGETRLNWIAITAS